MYISKMTLQNFKRFEEVSIPLDRSVTLLLGPNSSGKSSIIKALLALKQTASASNENETLATQGEYVDLGVYKDYVHSHDALRNIAISTTFKGYDETFLMPSGSDGTLTIRLEYSHDHITEQARLQQLEVRDGASDESILLVSKKKTRDSYYLELSGDALKKYIEPITPTNNETEKTKEPAPQKISVRVEDRFSIVQENVPSAVAKPGLQNVIPYIAKIVVNEYLRGLDKDFFYLGPLRRSPSRSYARTGHLLSVGPAGEHTPSVLANLKARAAKERSATPIHKPRLEELNSWVTRLFPDKIVTTESINELIKLKLSNNDGTSDAISDVGFGVSQILPILVQIAVMPDGSTLLIEQPELHLHPSIQTRLAEIIAKASRSGRRFLVETHSEHFVRGLQLEIASSSNAASSEGLTPEDVSFVYIPQAPNPPVLLEVNEWGEFTQEWPTGFFDEAYRLAMLLLHKKMESHHGMTKDKGAS